MTYQFDPILGTGRDGKVTLAEQQEGFNRGTAAQQAAFQSSVSGDALTIAVDATVPTGGSGLVQGSPAGQRTWTVTGPGAATAAYHPDGYIYEPSGLNTYCHINTGATKVRRVRQVSHGSICTIEIALDENLSNMIHQNFSSGGSAAMTFWKTGVGISQQPRWGKIVAACPVFTDGPHVFELEVFDKFALAYVDGSLVTISYDERFSSIQGGWIFGQLHTGAKPTKIYSLQAWTGLEYTDAGERNVAAAAVSAKSVLSYAVNVGKPGGVGYIPNGDSYYWTDHAAGHVFASHSSTTVHSKGTVAGAEGRFRATANVGSWVELRAENNGRNTLAVSQNGSTRIECIAVPGNLSRMDALIPMTKPGYTVATLPSASSLGARTCAFVTDAASPVFGSAVVGGGAVVVPVYSNGSAWIVG